MNVAVRKETKKGMKLHFVLPKLIQLELTYSGGKSGIEK